MYLLTAVKMAVVLIVLGVLVYLYRRRQEVEGYLFLKLAGFLFAGFFTFSVNGLSFPLGFIIVGMFNAKIRRNRRIKLQAALLGLLLFFMQFIYPAAEKYLYERPREIPVTDMQVGGFDFTGQWKAITANLKVNPDARLDSFEAVYGSNGAIRMLDFDFVVREQDEFVYYEADYDDRERNSMTVKRHRVGDQWAQFDRSVKADYFFERLNGFDLVRIKPAVNYPTYKLHLWEYGAHVLYGIEDTRKYRIDLDQIREISNDELPIRGRLISVCGVNSISSEVPTSECGERADYLFDVMPGKGS